MRHSLLTRDLTVTGTAFLWGDRRFRLVRIVTSDARRERVVSHWVDLRESGWPGRIVRMTERAEPAVPWRRLRLAGPDCTNDRAGRTRGPVAPAA
jgi:hypothetical protein